MYFKILNLKIYVAQRKYFRELLFAASLYSPVSPTLPPRRDQCPSLPSGWLFSVAATGHTLLEGLNSACCS